MDDRILLEPIDADDRTAGGIILPDSAKEKPQCGTVVAAGPGKLLDTGKRGEPGVKIGERVYYGKYSGTEIDFGMSTYVVVRENDILAVAD